MSVNFLPYCFIIYLWTNLIIFWLWIFGLSTQTHILLHCFTLLFLLFKVPRLCLTVQAVPLHVSAPNLMLLQKQRIPSMQNFPPISIYLRNPCKCWWIVPSGFDMVFSSELRKCLRIATVAARESPNAVKWGAYCCLGVEPITITLAVCGRLSSVFFSPQADGSITRLPSFHRWQDVFIKIVSWQ